MAKAAGPIIVGKAFHVFGDARRVRYQGEVLGMVGADHVLVQYFEFGFGFASTMEIVSIARMSSVAEAFAAGHWQFYANVEEMRDWYETHGYGERERA